MSFLNSIKNTNNGTVEDVINSKSPRTTNYAAYDKYRPYLDTLDYGHYGPGSQYFGSTDAAEFRQGAAVNSFAEAAKKLQDAGAFNELSVTDQPQSEVYKRFKGLV